MKCIYCGCKESKVIDSRTSDDGTSIRRRRECIECGKRFTTYETVVTTPILVIKSNGTRQAFDINKVRGGIIKAAKNARCLCMVSINSAKISSAKSITPWRRRSLQKR